MRRRAVPPLTKRFKVGPTGASPQARPSQPTPAMRGGKTASKISGGALAVAEWDGRRAGDPPHFERDPWDWPHVEFAMRGAMRVLRQLPHSQGERPQEPGCLWPDWLPDYPDGEAGPLWTRPTAAQIDQTIEIVGWFGAIAMSRVKRGLVAYVAGVRWSRIREISGDARTPYTLRSRIYRAEFLAIACTLNAEKRILPKDVASVPFFGL